MKTIGKSNLVGSRLAYGCWRLAGSEGAGALPPEVGVRAVLAAVDAGFTIFDHADIYGRGACERIFGEALRARPGLREKIVITTKCGICPPWNGAQHCYNNSEDWIVQCVEGSLRRLGVDGVELLMIHRPDYLGDPTEIASAFSRLREAGKVRWFGVSNFRPSQVATLQAACDFPLVTNQVEVSLTALGTLEDGTLDQCLELGMTPMAWSPLARGAIFAEPRSAKEAELQQTMDRIATQYGGSRTIVALAWLLRHPSGMLPIIGTLNPARIVEAAQAQTVSMSREDWYALLIAARGVRLP